MLNKLTLCLCVCVCVCSFSCSFPLWFITAYWMASCAIPSRTLAPIHPACNSSRLLIPTSHPTPRWQLHVCSLFLCVCFTDKFICVIFYIPHISDITGINLSFSFWLTSLGMIISRSVSVPVNGMSFFLMVEEYSIVYMYRIFKDLNLEPSKTASSSVGS